MSSKTKHNSNVKKTKLSKREVATKILALFLAIITVLGIVMMIVPVTDDHNHTDAGGDIHAGDNHYIELPVTPQVPSPNNELTIP